jgi:hypothetical protein
MLLELGAISTLVLTRSIFEAGVELLQLVRVGAEQVMSMFRLQRLSI